MYLEISARRTHKTSRLVRELDYHLATHPDNRVCLTVHNIVHSKHIEELVNPRHINRLLININFGRHAKQLRGIMRPNDPRILYMWDEFDFISDPHNVPIMQHGYYNTTPKFQRRLEDWENWRNDLLLRLLIANDFMYTAHHGMKAFFNQGDGMKKFFKEYDGTLMEVGTERFNNKYMSGFDTAEPEPQQVRRDQPNHDDAVIREQFEL